jgi:integrase
MPKPLLLHRPAGIYVRFRVPTDLRDRVGSRFLVRPLRQAPGEGARLAAALLDVALSNAFRRMRQGGGVVDINKLLKDAENAVQLTIGEVRLPNGTHLTNVRIDTPEDERQFRDLMSAATPSSPAQTPRATSSVERKMHHRDDFFSHQMEVHLADLERGGRDKKTLMESRHTLALFRGIVGNKVVSELSADHCRNFFDAVVHWPRHATKRQEFAGLGIRETIAKAKAMREPPPAAATLEKHRQRLSTFINWARRNKLMADNPLHGLVRQKKDVTQDDTGRPFTQDELNAIFEPDAFGDWSKGNAHRYWVPILALYSGARVTELSQLYVADIEVVQRIPGFHINKRFPGQKLKNAGSRRFVPLAQPVLDCGFLDFVEALKAKGQDRLFPELPNNDGLGFGRQMSKQFGAYIKKRGITEEGMGMHAFRHTLATRLVAAKVSKDVIARITGHMREGDVLTRYYIDEPTLKERTEALTLFDAGMMIRLAKW